MDISERRNSGKGGGDRSRTGLIFYRSKNFATIKDNPRRGKCRVLTAVQIRLRQDLVGNCETWRILKKYSKLWGNAAHFYSEYWIECYGSRLHGGHVKNFIGFRISGKFRLKYENRTKFYPIFPRNSVFEKSLENIGKWEKVSAKFFFELQHLMQFYFVHFTEY